jgi:hypothetical protein
MGKSNCRQWGGESVAEHKVRIHAINNTVGDDFFIAIDRLLFGERLWPWFEQFVETHSTFALSARQN